MFPSKNRLVFVLLGLGGLFVRLGLAVDFVPLGGDSDVSIYRDRVTGSAINPSLFVGDFNGDGLSDLAFVDYSEGNINAMTTVIFGPLATDLRSSVNAGFQVNSNVTTTGDFNNDKIDDLVFVATDTISILFGNQTLSGTIDISQNKADVVFLSSSDGSFSSEVSGDFNGDQHLDLTFLDIETSIIKSRVLFGPDSFTRGVYDVEEISHQAVILFPNLLLNSPGLSHSHDIDGDGKDELVLRSNYRASMGDPSSVVLQVYRGRTQWITPWDMTTTPADFTIRENPGIDLRIPSPSNNGIVDFNGDGLCEIVIHSHRLFPLIDQMNLLDGTFITASTPAIVNITTGQPGEPLITPILVAPNPEGYGLGTGDFDGDGRGDLFIPDINNGSMDAILSSDYSSGIPGEFTTPSFSIAHSPANTVLADLNHDGRADVLFPYSGTIRIPTGFASGAIFGYYGFHPLRNPSVTVKERVDARWADVLLSVEGDPVQMRFSDGVDDSVRDQWIPFGETYRVPLSPSAGSKTVTVTFRNAYQRMSDPVSFQTTVDTPEAGISPVTNRIRPGERALWDLRVPQPSHVRARILLTTGEPLVEIFNNEGGPGILPLEWNGQNSAGQSVAPGVYVLLVEMDGQEMKTTVLVRR